MSIIIPQSSGICESMLKWFLKICWNMLKDGARKISIVIGELHHHWELSDVIHKVGQKSRPVCPFLPISPYANSSWDLEFPIPIVIPMGVLSPGGLLEARGHLFLHLRARLYWPDGSTWPVISLVQVQVHLGWWIEARKWDTLAAPPVLLLTPFLAILLHALTQEVIDKHGSIILPEHKFWWCSEPLGLGLLVLFRAFKTKNCVLKILKMEMKRLPMEIIQSQSHMPWSLSLRWVSDKHILDYFGLSIGHST